MNDIDILEELINEYKNNVWNEYPYRFNEEIIQAIETLISENKKLKEENDLLKSKLNIWENLKNEDFIPKSKVEELKEQYKNKLDIQDNQTYTFKEVVQTWINICESLLGKE